MASTVTLGGNPIDVAGNFPQAGQTAPAFSLVGADLADVPLKQFSGKKNVVLYFYPKAMTTGCTVQACGIRDSQKALAKLDTVVLGVSPDAVARRRRGPDGHAARRPPRGRPRLPIMDREAGQCSGGGEGGGASGR